MTKLNLPDPNILDMIRTRQERRRRIRDGDNPLISEWRQEWQQQIRAEHDSSEPVSTRPLTADEWQEFKRLFVASIGGEDIFEDTGMTHREFLKYISTGWRENSEYDAARREERLRPYQQNLRAWLNQLDDEDEGPV